VRTIWRILSSIKPYWRRESLAYLTLLSINALQLYMPLLIRRIIDEGISKGDFALLALLSLTLIGIDLVRGALNFTQGYLTEWVSQYIAYDFRNAIYRKLQRLSFSYHDRAQTGQLLSRATSDVERLRFLTGRGLLRLVDSAVLFFGTAAIMMSINPRLAILALAAVPWLAVIATRFSGQVRPLFRLAQNQLGEVATFIQDSLTGLRIVKAFAQEGAESKRFATKNEALFETNVKAARKRSTYSPLLDLIANLGTVFILWYGGSLVIRGELTLGELVAFNSYLLQLVMPMRRLGMLISMLSQAQASGERIFEILDAESEVKQAEDAIPMPRIEGNVKFENVSFRYFGSAKPVLDRVSLEAKPGQVVAILGATGSGKSTIINLIPRFYDCTQGRILVDGMDIRSVTLDSLRRQIGIVLQETKLFAATIRENITFGRPDTTDEEMIAAAKSAAAHDFIHSFPDGYDTVVGERGVTLSGGQRQRIAIARALLVDPRILILDDSTSSVDAETERLIQQALARLMHGRTSFVIAQRLSSVRNADLILVMDRGRLVTQGRHEDLLRDSGIYAEIYYSQLAPERARAPQAEPSAVPAN
jgi:ATP-binding cassette subfamily B protein